MANPIRPPHKIKNDSKPGSGQGGQGGRTIGVRPVSPAGSGRTARHNAGQNSAPGGGQQASHTLPKPDRLVAHTPPKPAQNAARPNPILKPTHTVSRETSAPVRPAQTPKPTAQHILTTQRPTLQHSVNTAAQNAAQSAAQSAMHTTVNPAAQSSGPSLGKMLRTSVALGAGSALLGALLSGAMRSGQSLQDLQKMPELQGYSQEELRQAMEEIQQGNADYEEAPDPFASAVECSHCGAPIPAGVRVCQYCDCPRSGEEETL